LWVFVALIGLVLSLGSDPLAAMNRGDAAFIRIAYPEAAEAYRAGLAAAPDDRQLLWRFSRVCVCMAEVEEDPGKRKAFLAQGEEAARHCIRIDSTMAEGYTWLAGALGYQALDAGMSDQVRISQELVAATDAAVRLDPSNDAAWSIRGSFFRALGNVGWVKRQLAAILLGSIPQGGFAEAEDALKTAIRLAPDIMRHRYELGVLYRDQGRNEEARQMLREAAALEIRTAIDRPRREKALKLVRELGEGG
jgi:tetratricopeptide (TPR) repeat protein